MITEAEAKVYLQTYPYSKLFTLCIACNEIHAVNSHEGLKGIVGYGHYTYRGQRRLTAYIEMCNPCEITPRLYEVYT